MLKKVVFDLEGKDGNAFALLAGWKRAAHDQGWTHEDTMYVLEEATSGDYDHLVQTLMTYSETSSQCKCCGFDKEFPCDCTDCSGDEDTCDCTYCHEIEGPFDYWWN